MTTARFHVQAQTCVRRSPTGQIRLSRQARKGEGEGATHAVEEGQAAKVAKADEQARQGRAEQDPVDGRLLPVVKRSKAAREEPLLACGDDEAAAPRGPVSP